MVRALTSLARANTAVADPKTHLNVVLHWPIVNMGSMIITHRSLLLQPLLAAAAPTDGELLPLVTMSRAVVSKVMSGCMGGTQVAALCLPAAT